MENRQVALTLGMTIGKQAFDNNLSRFINQTYKLLPLREQGKDWKKPLQTLMEEMAGMKQLVIGQDQLFFLILCKMRGLLELNSQNDMLLYRRVVLELLSLLSNLKQNVNVT